MEDFFQPIQNNKPYFKAAFQGFAGSGKTYTAALMAIGLYKKIGSTKPVIIFDTEMASKFLKPLFEKNGIQVLVKNSRSLADLKETMRRMRDGFSDVLIIDSISHVWEDFLSAYQKRKNRTTLQFQDWGVIKPTWKAEFSDPFVRDPYHIIMTGRAGYEYDNEINEETKKREIFKSGVKMKVEGETAYEPDLLVMMERMQLMEAGDIKGVERRAVVIKDRSTLLDGKVFPQPKFVDFEPAVDALLSNPIKPTTTAELDAADLIKTEEEKVAFIRSRDIALEKIEAYLTEVFPGSSADAKRNKVLALKHAYNSASWTEIKGMNPTVLEAGLTKLQDFVQQLINPDQPPFEG